MLSYAEINEADQYFRDRKDSAHWGVMTEEQKIAALEHAARILDHSFQWKGIPAEPGQPMRWPRRNVFDSDGILLSCTEVPLPIRHAVLEQALYMTAPSAQGRNTLNADGIKSASLGAMSITFENTAEQEFISPEAIRLVHGLGYFCSSGKNTGKNGFLMRG